jgi:eukaryotic-like serine/threonine-protein kinase
MARKAAALVKNPSPMTQIGRYEIVRRTGNHGLESFYEAFDPLMGRTVTIRIADHAPEQPDKRPPALQLIELDHPNILKILAVDSDGDRPYLVLETFEGVSVASMLAAAHEIPAHQAMKFLLRAAEAMDYAHSRGLVHGRLTPEALLFDASGELKVSGFDTVPADSEDPRLLVASVPYLSPEFLKGDPTKGYSDQYSLAVIAFQMLTGTLPFAAASTIAALRNIAFANPVFPQSSPRFPPAVKRVVERALSKTPAARYSSCSEFAVEMESALNAKQAMPTRLAPSDTAAHGASRSLWLFEDRRILWGVAAVFLVGVVLMILALSKSGQPNAPAKAKPAAAVPAAVPAPSSTAPENKATVSPAGERTRSTKPARVRSTTGAVVQPVAGDRNKKTEPVKLKPVEPKIP